MDAIKNQLRSIIQWGDPDKWQIFHRATDRGDELKNATKLILQPGQGCIFTYEGQIEAVFEEPGIYDLKTDNVPFLTTLKNTMNAFESQHKVGLWLYRTAEIVNIRWGTPIPIAYNDPIYTFPILLRGHGNYSLRITNPKKFFTQVIAGEDNYYASDLQTLFLSRITQPISNYLANAKFSFADIDANIEQIAADAQTRTNEVFEELGFKLVNFRIEGTTFDKETLDRIGEIADVQADAKAAELAGVSFTELQQLKSMRDMAKNEGQAGAGMGMMAGMNMGNMMGGQMATQTSQTDQPNIRQKLNALKDLFEDGLIDEDEFKAKKITS